MMQLWTWLDRYLGRGSYRWLRWIDPHRENMQLTYAERVSDLLQPGVRWLDAGCGHQAFPHVQANVEQEAAGRVRQAVGCDAVLSALNEHRSIRTRVCCNLDHLPFATGSFDVLTLGMVAEHLNSPETVFAELVRALAPNGVLVVFTPNSTGYISLAVRLGNRVLPRWFVLRVIHFMHGRDAEDVFPTYYRANTRKRLRELAAQAGLTEDDCLLRATRPLFYFAAPLSVLEMLVVRLLRLLGCDEFVADNILGFYRVQPSRSPATRPPEMVTAE